MNYSEMGLIGFSNEKFTQDMCDKFNDFKEQYEACTKRNMTTDEITMLSNLLKSTIDYVSEKFIRDIMFH